MSQDMKTGTRVMTCCVGGWVMVVWGMGIFALSMGAPIIFPIIAFGMGCFAIFVFGSACRANMQGGGLPTVHKYSERPTTYTEDYEVEKEPKSKKLVKVYLIPAECPSCNSPISPEQVKWIGPLKAVCPFCEAIIEGTEKTY